MTEGIKKEEGHQGASKGQIGRRSGDITVVKKAKMAKKRQRYNKHS